MQNLKDSPPWRKLSSGWDKQVFVSKRVPPLGFETKNISNTATNDASKSSEREPDIYEFSEEYMDDQQSSSTAESKTVPSQFTSPTPSLHEPTEPFTEDFIPVPSSPDWGTNFQSSEVPPIVLSEEQIKIYNEVMRGQNVFFTGSAGSSNSPFL